MSPDIVIYMIDHNGLYLGRRIGNPSNVMAAHETDGLGDFVLTPPPSFVIPHKWNGLEWVKVETE